MATFVWMFSAILAAAATPAAKLPPGLAHEMTSAIAALNKALGLESWNDPNEKPCVDRGGMDGLIKDVSAEDTRKCAEMALESGLPELGKSYVIGITMAAIGPATVFAVGKEAAAGWGAYSCDPSRKCPPTKLSAPSKPAKRLAERYRRACADSKTIWVPDRESACGEPTSEAAK